MQDGADATIATLKAIEHQISQTAVVLVDMCSYAGTGNVLKVQELLHYCDEHIDKTPKENPDKTTDKQPTHKKSKSSSLSKSPRVKPHAFDGSASTDTGMQMQSLDEGITEKSDRIALKVLQIQEKVR